MLVTAVESTLLSAAAYDASRQLLWLEFQSGALYCYFGVPPTVHQELIGASSKGKYFNLNIRGHFAYRKEAHGGRCGQQRGMARTHRTAPSDNSD
jgi:hypothetical protein